MKVVNSKQMREIESELINRLGVPSIILMENAARGAAEICLDCLEYRRDKYAAAKVCIFAGTGNNGGDGFAIARHLYVHGLKVGIYIPADPSSISGDALINLEIAKKFGIPIISEGDIINETLKADLVIDSMLGTGLCRELDCCYARAADIINSYAAYVAAIDIPTGISSDSGEIMGDAVKADITITIGLPKLGLYLYPACAYVGEIRTVDICIPESLVIDREIFTEITDDAVARRLLPPRMPRSNKGTYGKAYVIAGSAEMPGAACLVSLAAYRIGAGLVRICAVPEVVDKVQNFLPEVISSVLPNENGLLCRASFEALCAVLPGANVIMLGPGIGQGNCVDEFIDSIIKSADLPMVLDADALNSISKNPSALLGLKKQCVITPHPGEMSRLTGMDISEIVENTIDTARAFSKKYNVVTVLKDARTIIAHPSGYVYVNTAGTPAMAKAGSGDVLTGIIGGLMAQGMEAFQAAALGCHIHGKAGCAAEKSLSAYSVNASDLISRLPQAVSEISG